MKKLLCLVASMVIFTGCGMTKDSPTTKGVLETKIRDWQKMEAPLQTDLPEILDSVLFDREETYLLLEEIMKEAQDMTYMSDEKQFGVEDHWQTSQEFVNNNYTGDCEDMAIYAYYLIRKARIFADNDVTIRIVGNEDKGLHVVIAVYSSTEPVFVDNGYVRRLRNLYDEVFMEFSLFTIW